MTKIITSIFCFFLLSIAASAQLCTFTLSGQVTNLQNSQVVSGQTIVITTINGIDTVFTNPNGAYNYSTLSPCDSSIAFTLTVPACGTVTNTTLLVAPNQPLVYNFGVCANTQPSCIAVANISQTGNTIQFNYSGSSSAGTVTSVMWDMGNGYTTNNYPNGGSYMYTVPGVYQTCVTVTWSNGCSSTDCESVVISPNTLDSCNVDINASTSANSLSAQFSWIGGSFGGASVQDVTWSFGNGSQTTSLPNGGTYDYPTAGTYDLCVNVTWTSGCTATSCTTIVVGPSIQQNICGCVNYVDANNDTLNIGCGLAYLVQFDSVANTTIVVDTVNITPNGYCFYGNYTGPYTVLAVPCNAPSGGLLFPVLPTYLGNVLDWQSASTANYGFNNYVSNCITLQTGQNSQGPAQIGGTILWGDDKAPGDPVVGINVLLLDNNGDAIEFAVTDVEGFYSFSSLAYGTYEIHPEVPGFTTYPAYVTLSAENQDVELDNFYLGFGAVAMAGIEESTISIGGLYPNPARETSTLTITSKEAGNANIRITDLTGKVVSQMPKNIIKGQQNIPLNIEGLNAGVYTVTLTLNGQQLHVKLIKQ